MDPRRPQEIIPYHTRPVESKNDFVPTLSLMASGASMILRQPLLGWIAIYLSMTSYMTQSQRGGGGEGAALSTVVLPVSTLISQYFPLLFPVRA